MHATPIGPYLSDRLPTLVVDGSSWFISLPGVDNTFKTFVTPVPEPATGTTIALGMAAAALRRARAKKSRDSV